MPTFYYLTLRQPAGAQSGIQVSQVAKDTFTELKGRKHKYVIFSLSASNREVEVLKSSSSTDYDEFLNDLPEDQCRWAVYDLEFEKPDGGKRTKLCFFSW
jgi:cofilin